MRDPYAVLGVSRTADADTIRKKYKELARRFHPDLNKSPGAEKRFKEINEANEVIGDPEKRKLWDEFGEVSTKPGFDANKARAWKQGFGGGGGGFPGGGFPGGGFAGGDLGDLLGSMFGAGQRRRGPPGFGRRAPPKGVDAEVTIRVSLADLLTGESQTVQFQRAGADGRMTPESLKFAIPAGVRDGGKFRLRGKGGPGPAGGRPGDLLVTVKVAPHASLRADGDDLVMDLPITFGEAARGGSIEVPTPEGPVRIKVPAGVTGGQKLRLRKRGLRKKGDERGNLVLILRPTLPEGSEALQELAEHVDALYDGDVRSTLTF